jgi:ATP-dependent RNA helicase DHX33
MHARSVVASKEHGCTSEVLSIVSVLSSSAKLFFDISDQREAIGDARRKFKHPSGDHLTILRVMQAYEEIAHESKSARAEWCRGSFINERALLEARKIRDQLRGTCERVKIDWKATCGEDHDLVLRSLAQGLVHNSAMLQPDKTYKQLVGLSVRFYGLFRISSTKPFCADSLVVTDCKDSPKFDNCG